MAAHNAQHMLHGNQNPDHMETIEDYRHNDAWEGPITINNHLIKEQVGFRPGKSCTSQLLNLIHYIMDNITCFVDLSAAYDTVNH